MTPCRLRSRPAVSVVTMPIAFMARAAALVGAAIARINLLSEVTAVVVSKPPNVAVARAAFNSLKLTPAAFAVGITMPIDCASSPNVVRPNLTVVNRISLMRVASLAPS